MRIDAHPVLPEQLMAYLDGEVSPDVAARISTHLSECSQCQSAAADLEGLSAHLREWVVEVPEVDLPRTEIRVPVRSRRFRWAWPAAALATVVLVSFLFLSEPRFNRAIPQSRAVLNDIAVKKEQLTLIARSASIQFRANDFNRVRGAIDQILASHKGYAVQMTLNAPQAAPRSLYGTLRVPAADLEATLTELEKLGAVQSETRTGEEVTRESMDLDARLNNARNTEQRLSALLRDRTAKLQDVLAVEEKIDATRLEIERMESDRKNLSNRIEFASIELRVVEEYQAQLGGGRTPAFSTLRNAAVNGAHAVSDSLIAAASFLLSAGPMLILWLAILFFPARFVWRRLRKSL